MTPCKDCEQAATRPQWGGYRTACQQCHVRALAQALPFWQAEKEGKLLPTYKLALQGVFGDDWEAGHRLVKVERERIKGLVRSES